MSHTSSYQVERTELVGPPTPGRLYVCARDTDEPDKLVLRCPCGCGTIFELPTAGRRAWTLTVTAGLPTVTPPIELHAGCRSRFSITDGVVLWLPNSTRRNLDPVGV